MRRMLAASLLLPVFASAAPINAPPLLPEAQIAALANELSGETAKRNLEGLARFHRQRGSQGFHSAASLIAERAQAYGLSDVEVLRFATDGRTMYGTQRARQGWDAEQGDLIEVEAGRSTTLASYAATPIALAEDSVSGEVTADLVDVGDGTSETDYAGKDARGKLVLVAAQPGAVQDLAVGKFGAAGIVSYAQNQPTAWSGENDGAVRWGHLGSFSASPTFAFMVSLRVARSLQSRLRLGESIHLHAIVKAGQHDSAYEIVTATIPGADPALKAAEIAYSCHLDHQRPGANDNASGCVTILEVARTLQKLIASGALPRPARTIRFVWPPEVEGTVTLLNARPDFANRIKAAIHMDMVGGGSETKAVFHVTRGPASLPSFVHDIAWAFADWANEQTYQFAATGSAAYPLVAAEGSKDPLRAVFSAFTMGSDHDVYQDSSFGIPAIYLNDWPDRYIHTNLDTAANIDPTKLKRAAFIGAASGYFIASLSTRDIEAASHAINMGKLMRAVTAMQRHTAPEASELYEKRVRASLDLFLTGAVAPARHPASKAAGDAAIVVHRRREPRGPLVVFGYDYFAEHLKAAGGKTPALLSYTGSWGAGEEYAYEALNLADGTRNAQQITDALTAEYGSVPLALVLEYLQALKAIGVAE